MPWVSEDSRIARGCAALQDADDAGFAHALPRQAQHQCVELATAERHGRSTFLGPDELAAVQAPRGQPHADAVVHEHLHAVGSAVGKEVSMMRSGLAED